MQKLKNLKLIIALLLISISMSLAYLFFNETEETMWFLVSVFELGTISILAFILFKLIDILETK